MNITYNKLEQSFYRQSPEIVAELLVGKLFVKIIDDNIRLISRICETEAYLSHDDLSSHSAVGKTKRNDAMFCEGGVLYVYKIYGVHHCINIVSEGLDIGSAVLIRAGEPISEIAEMCQNRYNMGKQGPTKAEFNKLLKGPGNFAKAFDINLNYNKHSLLSDDIFILQDDYKCMVSTSPRIGITKSRDLMLRFYDSSSKFISGKK